MIPHNPDLMPWVPAVAEAWYKGHPNYPGDRNLDYKPLRLFAIWLAERNGIKLKEPVPADIQEVMVNSFEKIARFVAGDRLYRMYSLDRIERFYKQEIMQKMAEKRRTSGPVV